MLIRKQASGTRNVALAAALLLALASTGCNAHSADGADNAYGTLPLPAATLGQDNGSLTSALPNPRDPHRQFRIRAAGHVLAASFRHPARSMR